MQTLPLPNNRESQKRRRIGHRARVVEFALGVLDGCAFAGDRRRVDVDLFDDRVLQIELEDTLGQVHLDFASFVAGLRPAVEHEEPAQGEDKKNRGQYVGHR